MPIPTLPDHDVGEGHTRWEVIYTSGPELTLIRLVRSFASTRLIFISAVIARLRRQTSLFHVRFQCRNTHLDCLPSIVFTHLNVVRGRFLLPFRSLSIFKPRPLLPHFVILLFLFSIVCLTFVKRPLPKPMHSSISHFRSSDLEPDFKGVRKHFIFIPSTLLPARCNVSCFKVMFGLTV
jgi:hypothetical protein